MKQNIRKSSTISKHSAAMHNRCKCIAPSKCTHTLWMFAFSPPYKREAVIDAQGRRALKESQAKMNFLKSGKWLIFVNKSKIDKVWAKIKKSTEQGNLGTSSKVSTSYSFDGHVNKKSHVICVYTYDCTDKKDVKRVRQKLRDLGITNKIGYKRDLDTILNKYSYNTKEKISMYYE